MVEGGEEMKNNELLISSGEIAISGLEKIEPLAHELTRMSFTTADMNIALKLNEVIEKVNLIMEYLNQGVGK